MTNAPARAPAENDEPPRRPHEGGTRTLLRVGAVTSGVGIALAASGDPSLARWLVLAGMLLLVYGLHRFGRLGADDPLDLEPERDEA